MDDESISSTHVRALRETSKALRTSEFPWTAHDLFEQRLIGHNPNDAAELGQFTRHRNRANLLPDRELFAVSPRRTWNRALVIAATRRDRARYNTGSV